MRCLPFVLLAAAAVSPWLIGDRYVLHVSTMIAVMIILALAMNLMLVIGQLSLAHSAFMGIGAYTSALLTLRLGVTPLPSLVVSACICALAASVLGPVFLRIKGVYFVLLTYAFGQIVNLVFQEWTDVFGGNSGLYGIAKLSAFGYRVRDPALVYGIALTFALVFFLLVHAIRRSDIGALLRSLEANEPLSLSFGVSALTWRVAVFMLTAAMAGIAGSLYAHIIGFLSPDVFGFRLSVDLIVMNVVGGVSSAWGPVLGALLTVPLLELLRGVKEYQMLAYGIALMAVMLFFRDGLMGVFASMAQRVRRKPRGLGGS